MIGTITRILAKAGWKSMNGPLADERRRLAGAVAPAAYASYDPRLLAGAGWYGYRIALKGGDRQMMERARYMLEQQYVIRDSYEYYADDIYTLGVLLRQRVPHYGIGGGSAPAPEPDALNFYMPDGGTITLTKTGSPTVVELEYSIDGGATWQVWEEVGNVRSITLAAGQKMHVRNASATSTSFSLSNIDYYNFSLSNITYGGGDIRSLLCKIKDNAICTSHCLRNIFRGCIKLKESPAFGFTELASNCYRNALYETSIEQSPVLIAVNIPLYAYQNMFTYCYSLKKVTTYMNQVDAISLNNWLLNVAATGDFYCPAELTIQTGASGIPAGWTRHDI